MAEEYHVVSAFSFDRACLAEGLSQIGYKGHAQLKGYQDPHIESNYDVKNDLFCSDFPRVSDQKKLKKEDCDYLITPEGNVVYLWDDFGLWKNLKNLDAKESIDCADNIDLIFSSSSPEHQPAVERLRCSGKIIARTSMFYGSNGYDEKSEYGGKSASQSGYSFDFPRFKYNVFKGGSIVDTVLVDGYASIASTVTNDDFLAAMRARDYGRIVGAVEVLNVTRNTTRSPPILITDYLSKALGIPKDASKQT